MGAGEVLLSSGQDLVLSELVEWSWACPGPVDPCMSGDLGAVGLVLHWQIDLALAQLFFTLALTAGLKHPLITPIHPQLSLSLVWPLPGPFEAS